MVAELMQTFECNVKGINWQTQITARTLGKAKSEYLSRVRDAWPDVKYTDVRARSLGACVTTDEFLLTARYRGVPFARIGMKVDVDGRRGRIVGANSSANFDVVFDGSDVPINCHPNWMITYFAEDESVLATFGGTA